MKNQEKKDNTRLKLLYITEFFPSSTTLNLHGGVEMRTFLLTSKLAQENQISVICSKEKDKPSSQKLANIEIFRVGPTTHYTQEGRILARLSFIFASFFQALKSDFDLVEGSGILGLIPAFLAAKIKNKKAVAFIPDLFSRSRGLLNKGNTSLVSIAERLIVNNYWDKIITISQAVKKKLESRGVNPKKIAVIYPPVVTGSIKSPKTIYPSLSVVARLVKYKGLADIIEASAIIKKKFPKITINIVGDGPEKERLRTKIKELDLENNVKLLGFIKSHQEVLKIIKSSWIHVSCSHFEGFGISLAEAMSLNVPFVVTDIPVYREITHNSAGLFYTPGNPHELAEKITKLLNSRQYSKTLTQNNYKVIQSYQLSQITSQTLISYRKIIS